MLKLFSLEHKWWVLIAMTCSFAMVFIDQTAVPVALPAMHREFNTSLLMLDWILNAYLLTLAALTTLGGKIGDLYGHKMAFISGLLVFILSSVIVGFAPSDIWAVCGRGLQGIGGAFMVPAMTVIVTSQFRPEERGYALGILVGSAAFFAALGPLIGGVLTEYFSWRAVFWINIPFSLMSLLITAKLIPSKLHENPDNQLDWLGAFTLFIALFAFIFSVMEIPYYGLNSTIILSGLALSFIFFLSFIWIELHHDYPLIDLSLFKYRQIAIPVMIFVLIQAAFISSVFWAIFFQEILQVTPAEAGMMMIPFIAPVIFMPAWGGRLRDTYGSKLPIIIGSGCSVIGMLWIAIFSYSQNYLLLFPGLIIAGAGAPLIFSSAMTMAMGSVDIYQRGLVSGVCGAARQIGSSLGLAILGSLIIHLNKYYLESYLSTTNSLKDVNASQLDGLLSGAERAKETISHLPGPTINEIYQVVKTTHTFSFNMMMMVVVVFCILVFLLALQLPSQTTEIQKQ